MSGPVGHTFIYNIIILFIIIVFGFLAGTLSYYKAFKVNNKIVSAIEKYEGYNALSKEEIQERLSTLGYALQPLNCADEYRGMELVSLGENFSYCIYISSENPKRGEFYNYGVLTYMNLDLPIISMIKLPIFTRTNRIYKFTDTKSL